MKRKGRDIDTREKSTQQSAAEFFSEHQQIAGFDNPGKSLFTTIRELVENSLDAAESIHALPVIRVTVTEYTEEEHNKRHGIIIGDTSKSAVVNASTGNSEGLHEEAQQIEGVTPKQNIGRTSSLAQSGKELMYYTIQCQDNGCGIAPDLISELLGRVLSGSKHGVRQTRGKFGLGAKMALIWSKKSSGLPITVKSAYSPSVDKPATCVTTVVLDMDIQRNEPRVLSTSTSSLSIEGMEDDEKWCRGLDMNVTIAGAWSACRSRVLQYFQQLAVITPYAHLSLEFVSTRDQKKNFTAEFVRRSNQMPPMAETVLPHAKSLNNITMSHLLRTSYFGDMQKFLTSAVSGVQAKTASAIVTSLGLENCLPSDLSPSQVAALCQVLRDDVTIRPPSANCLSPAGEYNMRLGVLKELKPKLVATFTDKPGVNEGHPFLVEAAVSLGGVNVKEGINIFRFANRIPLLFEPGADVVTQVATRRINWGSYLMDPKRDSIGVYVSIVSTRIPFKGTSKEYIGDDVTEIQSSVRRALMGCCQQMRMHLAESLARRDVHERRKALLKYIPDISRAVVGVAQKIRDREDDPSGSKWSSQFTALEVDAALEPTTAARLTDFVNKAAANDQHAAGGGTEDASSAPRSGKDSSTSVSSKELYLSVRTSTSKPLYSSLNSSDSSFSATEGTWIKLLGRISGCVHLT